jgi:tyrosine-specific transport protein
VNAAFLIAGTTMGGGFLALPTVVAPSGFVPSATALVGVWAFFWVESLVIVECLCVCRAQARARRQSNDNGDADSEFYPGMTAAAKSAFGVIGESAVGVLLVLLLQATLVSQISRAGALFTSSSISSSYRVGCAATAMSVAAVVFGSPRVVATTANSLLTVIFVAMAVVLFGVGSPTADWSRLVATGGTNANWSGLPRAIPTFLQLLVYGEILPTVCQMLNYQRGPIRWAISVGSLLPLLLEVGWAALGIALVPSGTAMGDPVDALLAAGPIQGPLFILAVTAILTTIVGSYLALQSTFNDVFPGSSSSSSSKRNTKKAVPWRRRLVAASSIVLPALSIASISPDIFLRAIDFAGSYPVLLLWGLAPPAIAFRQRQNGNTKNPTDTLPLWWLTVLASVSLGIFGMSAIPDLRFLVKTLQSLLQQCF